MTTATHHDDIVVWCQHGDSQDFVQRYRWMTSQGVWIPVDTAGESNSFYDVDPRPAVTSEDVAAIVSSGKQRIGAYCKMCPNKVPMQYGAAQIALTRLSGIGQTRVPMAALRHAYNDIPKQLRT
jgi:hypothetical protein